VRCWCVTLVQTNLDPPPDPASWALSDPTASVSNGVWLFVQQKYSVGVVAFAELGSGCFICFAFELKLWGLNELEL